jgi:hypothetical protein
MADTRHKAHRQATKQAELRLESKKQTVTGHRASHTAEQIGELMDLLACQDLDARLMAIQTLGEIGDESTLGALKARMGPPLQEYWALSVAVGRLKERLATE